MKIIFAIVVTRLYLASASFLRQERQDPLQFDFTTVAPRSQGTTSAAAPAGAEVISRTTLPPEESEDINSATTNATTNTSNFTDVATTTESPSEPTPVPADSPLMRAVQVGEKEIRIEVDHVKHIVDDSEQAVMRMRAALASFRNKSTEIVEHAEHDDEIAHNTSRTLNEMRSVWGADGPNATDGTLGLSIKRMQALVTNATVRTQALQPIFEGSPAFGGSFAGRIATVNASISVEGPGIKDRMKQLRTAEVDASMNVSAYIDNRIPRAKNDLMVDINHQLIAQVESSQASFS